MSGTTSIEWTDFTSNPLRFRDANERDVWACVKTSPGCAHCYSEAIAERFKRGGPFTRAATAKVTPCLAEKELRHLLTARKLSGKRVFVCDMTDLFGDWVPDEMIAALFGVFAARPDVTFQVLTKRAERMAAWFKWIADDASSDGTMEARCFRYLAAAGGPDLSSPSSRQMQNRHGWPLPNVHLGVSVEDQPRADERIPHLLRVPAAVRFLSVEPLLGPVDLLATPAGDALSDCDDCNNHDPRCEACNGLGKIDWVIVGSESGPGARPMRVEWARAIHEQCVDAGVPFFFKQWSDARGRKIGDLDAIRALAPDLAVRQWPEVRP